MRPADKLDYLTSSIFTTMSLEKGRLLAAGREIIDLGIGSPDLPPPPHVRQALVDALQLPNAYGYPHFQGTPDLRRAFTDWFAERFDGVVLNPLEDVLTLMGSQDGLGHLPLALLNPGDLALLPDPAYPVYVSGVRLASAEIFPMPLRPENGYLPDLSLIPEEIAKRAKFLICSFPGNPVPAMADAGFYQEAVNFCRRHDIILIHDAAYSELYFDGNRPMSVLQIPGAKEVAVEFHSLSKSFSMAGCRIGFIAGRRDVVAALQRLKSNIDYGVFGPVQEAAKAALSGDQSYTREMSGVYQERRDVLLAGLKELGWEIDPPKATMFAWAKIPLRTTSMEFALRLLREAGVVVIPGSAFGEQGEGYVRIALVQPVDRLRQAVRQIEESGILSTAKG